MTEISPRDEAHREGRSAGIVGEVLLLAAALVVAAAGAAAADVARAAVDGATLRRVERDCRLLSAVRALDGDFDALPDAGRLGGGDGSKPVILGLLAGLAPLRLVSQSFIVKEELLAPRPDKLLTTVNAENEAILILHLDLNPFSLSVGRRNLHCLNL
jgi:hypothetical protein